MPRGFKQAAGKLPILDEFEKNFPQRLKPDIRLIDLMARINPCPFKTVAWDEFFRSL
jgi:hypothetical protein